MPKKVKTTSEIGFCFGVQRALDILDQVAREHGRADTLGELVHNEQVLQSLSSKGIDVIDSINDIKNEVVAISAHGVSPEMETELRRKATKVVDTTCPSVRQAQKAAHKLARDGFFVIIYGEKQHPEVQGILGWAKGKGIATLEVNSLAGMGKMPRKVGILSQTTQVPESFIQFVKQFLVQYLSNGIEVRIMDTICHGVRKRQTAALELAKEADLMLVIGGRNSANSKRLFELCAGVTETHLIKDISDIQPEWLSGKKKIGITSGTSTSRQTIDEVIRYTEGTRGPEQA